jgi:hypothetical protein
MAEQLENGKGFTEPFVWHFLNDYSSLEHPIDYWMPLGIVLYYVARICYGVEGEVLLNIFIWSLLSVLVYKDIWAKSRSIICSAFTFCTMLFCGRYLFYLLTTDNIAFYALLGFVFFKTTGEGRSRWYVTGAVSGLIALMRIEGLLIAVFGGICEFFRFRKFKNLLGFVIVFLLVLSPWLIRNYRVLGNPWPSNSKAIFLADYNDMFCRDTSVSLENYLEIGINDIVSQKVRGIWFAILNLVAAPGLFVMYPLWVLGLIAVWRQGGQYFLSIILFMVIFCGLVIPLQAEMGTALHVSAFFFPFFAVLNGLGLNKLVKRYKISLYCSLFIIMFIIAWSVFATYYSTVTLIEAYKETNAPYEAMLKNLDLASRKVVSAIPVKIYLETRASGVISCSRRAIEPIILAADFACDAIIMDRRADGYKPLPETEQWALVASNSMLQVFFRVEEP